MLEKSINHINKYTDRYLFIMFVLVYFMILFVLYYNKKPSYINLNDRTKTREEIVEDIIRNGCLNEEECKEFYKKFREDQLRKSWAE